MAWGVLTLRLLLGENLSEDVQWYKEALFEMWNFEKRTKTTSCLAFKEKLVITL